MKSDVISRLLLCFLLIFVKFIENQPNNPCGPCREFALLIIEPTFPSDMTGLANMHILEYYSKVGYDI